MKIAKNSERTTLNFALKVVMTFTVSRETESAKYGWQKNEERQIEHIYMLSIDIGNTVCALLLRSVSFWPQVFYVHSAAITKKSSSIHLFS